MVLSGMVPSGRRLPQRSKSLETAGSLCRNPGNRMDACMLDELKANNRAWAARKIASDPSFFRRLVAQQAPKYLWIGCADSRVPANEIVGLDPGELFVHRNVANLAPPQDANYLSVLQFAVDVLKIQHIIVVGHYGCGGVAAAVDGRRRGLVDHWLHPIRETYRAHKAELEAIPVLQTRLNRLCELNVISQVRNVAADVFVQTAWDRGQELAVHGWVYSLENGLVTDLNIRISNPDELAALQV
ncbi:MAG TPA: carbonic anhydrase [Rhodopila sp.]|nr:carbonic anhydrase [Rhodopila sp.]